MLELIVTGPEPTQGWRREIPEGEVVRLGRAPRHGWAVPWDLLISREHCELSANGAQVNVARLDSARNPVYFQEVDTTEFAIAAGQGFRIGQTMFQLVSVDLMDGASGSNIEEHSYGPDQLRQFKFHNAEYRLEVLAKLPNAISGAKSDEELAMAAVKILLQAMPHARAAACVQYSPNSTAADDNPIMMRWDSRNEDVGRFTPSRRLITASIQRGEGIIHIWQDTEESNPAFTVSGNLDWAFCMPLKGDSSHGWALYVTGQFGAPGATNVGEADLKGDLRFTELVSDLISSIRQVKSLQHEQAGLAQFFSPAVIEAVRTGSEAILEPRETDITVLFCDVRGFSRKSEDARDNLSELLNRVSHALGVMTAGILKYDGVIADFQGDAALGFWGWPSEPEEGPVAACRAALHIQREFRQAMNDENSPLSGFQVGIGVAHGRAIAGKIGTQEQIKVGAFGPVVNQGARLESMTKHVRAPILIDEVTAEHVRKLPSSDMRCRKLGRVRPYGMDAELSISELIAPYDADPRLTDEQIEQFEAAVDAVTEGRWQPALEMLNEMPVDDRTKDFLMIFIAMSSYEPPKDWDGVIQMMQK